MRRRLHIRYVFSIMTAVLIISVFRFCPQLADRYRQHVFIPLSHAVRPLTGFSRRPAADYILSFSGAWCVGELMGYFLTGSMRRICSFVHTAIPLLSGVLIAYSVLWAPLYACSPIIQPSEYDSQALAGFCGALIDSLNENPPVVTLSVNMEAEAARLMSEFTGQKLSRPKCTLYPSLMSMAGAAGIYVPFTFEAVYTPEDLAAAIPFTLCHELAHQAGWAREDEANLIAWLACRKEAGVFKYSADFCMLTGAMTLLHNMNTDLWRECVNFMNDDLLYVFRTANGLFEGDSNRNLIADWISDAFLKLNGQKEGAASYHRAALHALACFEDNGRMLPFENNKYFKID